MTPCLVGTGILQEVETCSPGCETGDGRHAASQQLLGARRGPRGRWGAGWVRSASKAKLARRTLMKIWDKTEPRGLSPGAPAIADTRCCYTEIRESEVQRRQTRGCPECAAMDSAHVFPPERELRPQAEESRRSLPAREGFHISQFVPVSLAVLSANVYSSSSQNQPNPREGGSVGICGVTTTAVSCQNHF